MDDTNKLNEFDRSRNEVRVYAVLHTRKGQWTTFETVAFTSGLSLTDATSALWNMTDQEVLRSKRRGETDVFCLPSKHPGSRRAELDHEARRMRLIEGPRMKALFSVSPSRSARERRHKD